MVTNTNKSTPLAVKFGRLPFGQYVPEGHVCVKDPPLTNSKPKPTASEFGTPVKFQLVFPTDVAVI